MKAQTIEQFHIIEWIREKFYINELDIELINRSQIKITDNKSASALVIYTKYKSIEMEMVR
jgi:hypothetical protein